MRAAILQSNYIPWKGYFDFIHSVDTFVFHDDTDYNKLSWRNRNRIKTPFGTRWLTIPTGHIKTGTALDAVQLPTHDWQSEHLRQLTASYRNAPHFSIVTEMLKEIYFGKRWVHLSELNQFAIQIIAKFLGITNVTFLNARDLHLTERSEEKVIKICKTIGATEYLTGPNTCAYIKAENWERAGIALHWKRYEYQAYDQLYPPFDHQVTILDLLFMKGREAQQYIWGENG